MKEAEIVYKKFLTTAKYWLKELDYYGEKQFKKKNSEKEWSIGQVYDHLLNGTYAFHIREIKNCLEHKQGGTEGGKKIKGVLLYMLKGFPPMKIKGLDTTGGYVPAQPESPAKTKDDFFRFIKEMQKAAKAIDEKGDLTYKTMHPSLGMLNSLEWYKLIEMHFRHHLRQKARLDETIRGIYKSADTDTHEDDFVDEEFDFDTK